LNPIEDEKEISVILSKPIERLQEVLPIEVTDHIHIIFSEKIDDSLFKDAFNARMVNWPKVVDLCDQILKHSQKHALTKSLKAEALMNLMDPLGNKLFNEVALITPYTIDDECAVADSLFYLGNHNDAIPHYLTAALHGFKYAQHKLASCYFSGNGVPKSLETAKKWWKRAADQGLTISKYNLAYCTKDKDEQFRLYKEGAEEGYAKSQHKLGICYLQGIGCEKDERLGNWWCDKGQNIEGKEEADEEEE
jgi:hypothetical protein